MISPKPTIRQQKPSGRDNRNCRRKCIFARLWIYQRKIPIENNDKQHPIPIVTCGIRLAKTEPNCLTRLKSHQKPSSIKVILKRAGTENSTIERGEETRTNGGKFQSWQAQRCLLRNKSSEKTSDSGRKNQEIYFFGIAALTVYLGSTKFPKRTLPHWLNIM